MAVSISFWVGSGSHTTNLTATTGQIRYCTSGFGTGIIINQYADRQFATDAAGSANNGALTPSQFNNSTTVNVNGQTAVALQSVPNNWANFNIVVSSDAGNITCRNPELRVCGLNAGVPDVVNAPTGVTLKIAELIHTATGVGVGGSGHSSWQTPTGAYPTNRVVGLAISPGSGGAAPQGSNTSGVRHDWYYLQSVSPTVTGLGQKHATYFVCEFF